MTRQQVMLGVGTVGNPESHLWIPLLSRLYLLRQPWKLRQESFKRRRYFQRRKYMSTICDDH